LILAENSLLYMFIFAEKNASPSGGVLEIFHRKILWKMQGGDVIYRFIMP